MRTKNLTTQILRFILSIVALASCNIPSGVTIAPPGHMFTPTPTLNSSHKIVSNNLPWHEAWRKEVGPSYSKGVSGSFPLLTCEDETIIMPVWDGEEILLIAMKSGDGSLIWSRQLSIPKPVLFGNPLTGSVERESPGRVDSVAADSDQVYVALPSLIESFNLSDGQEIWITHENLPSHTGYYIFPLDESQQLQVYGLSLAQTTTYYIDKRDGKVQSIQRYPAEMLQDGTEGKYLDAEKGLVRVDKQTDQALWTIPMSAPIRRWLTFATPNVMLVSSGPLLSSLFGIDPKLGRVLWKTPREIASNHTVMKGSVYTLDENARLIARNVVTGNELGQIVFDGAPLDVTHASEYWVISGECGLLIYFGDSHELVALQPN